MHYLIYHDNFPTLTQTAIGCRFVSKLENYHDILNKSYLLNNS